MSTSAEIRTYDLDAHLDLADNALEILQRLHLASGPDTAALLMHSQQIRSRRLTGDTLDALRTVHQRLLAEANPDFWLDEFFGQEGDCDAHQMDLVVDAAAVRLDEATTIGSLIEELERTMSSDSKMVPSENKS